MVLDNAKIGAGAVVTAGTEIPSRSLVLGSPAKIVRALDDITIKWKHNGTRV